MQLGSRSSQHNFSSVPAVNMSRSKFDRSHTVKDTFNFDYLVPCIVDEILPGDTVNLNLNTFGRLSTQKVPIMDNMYVDFFFFFVPNRLIWENWERFCGAQDSISTFTDYLVPTLTTTAVTGEIVGSLSDKFGIPTQVPGLAVNALPYRAYKLIWNEWFRAERLQNPLTVTHDDGPDLPSEYTLLKRGKRHDYFTSALPWPQAGDAISIPLGTSAPVTGIGKTTQSYASGDVNVYETDKSTFTTYSKHRIIDPAATDNWVRVQEDPTNTGYPNIRADLTNATAATINQLRQAFSLQSMLELDARGGTRYVELLQAHFNVVSPDFRLQRPEYLGGGSTKINSHPVAQTSPTSGSNAQGQLAAYGTTTDSGRIGFSKSFVEHGILMGMMCARADITYQQGLNKMWSRSTRYDYFWPKLQEIGEQAILNKEIYAQGSADPTDDAAVFGYQERYAEYRYAPSLIKGEFRSTYSTPLDQWHLAEEFGSMPSLNATFIVQNTPIERALTVTDGPDLIMDMWFDYKHTRPMMTYSVPSTLGRF